MENEKLKITPEVILSNMCEEFDWELANYYKLTTVKNHKENTIEHFLSCKDQPFFMNKMDKQLATFLQLSKQFTYKKGEELIGRVWDRQYYIWTKNLQLLPSDKYQRKKYAQECGLRTCLIVPHFFNEQFKGVFEFVTSEEWVEIPKMAKKIQNYTSYDDYSSLLSY